MSTAGIGRHRPFKRNLGFWKEAPMRTAVVDLMLREAAHHYNAGRPESAGVLCGDILNASPDHIPALHLAAVIAFAADRRAEGAELLGRVFRLDPDHVPALVTLGEALAVNGERDGAVTAFQRVVKLRPRDAGLHAKLGAALADLARFADAALVYRRALELDPNLVRARLSLAISLAADGQSADAEETYRALLAGDPTHWQAWRNLGDLLADDRRFDDAIAAYRQALAIDPNDPSLHGALGITLHRRGRLDDALVHYLRAVELAPNDKSALRRLGLALHEARRAREAVQIYRQVIDLDSTDFEIHTNLCACLIDLGQLDDARAAAERALMLNPGYAKARVNLGVILEHQNQTEAAIASYRRAISADPNDAGGYANLAVALHGKGELDEALAVSRRAVALAPEHPLVRLNHSHLLLICGDLQNGFADYRWRRECFGNRRSIAGPEWQGESFVGRTLLLFSEQGIGDTLQFIRYLPLVAARGGAKGGAIVLQVQATLVPLLRGLQNVTVIPSDATLPPFDLQQSLMDLAHVFGTTLASVPADVPYLHADPARVQLWRRALCDVAALKVGVVWAGSPTHKRDRYRSLAAAAVLSPLVTPGVQLYSLQKEPRLADMPVLAELGSDIIDLAPKLDDFAETAAALAALDLIISVDTSVAHLAGAMGRPVWVLLPYAQDWRWLRDREDSPWYPTLRLFRQEKPQAWDGVLTRVAAELGRLASRA
jgi:tetratricopeptide (TPR) repeat protein